MSEELVPVAFGQLREGQRFFMLGDWFVKHSSCYAMLWNARTKVPMDPGCEVFRPVERTELARTSWDA